MRKLFQRLRKRSRPARRAACPPSGLEKLERRVMLSANPSFEPQRVFDSWGPVEWVDFDSDGDLDVSLGYNGQGGSLSIYHNTDGVFVRQGFNIGDTIKSLDWADYDNDGDMDLLAETARDYYFAARVFRNDAGALTEVYSTPRIGYASVKWGDYDGDGDADFVVASDGATLYRNDGGTFEDSGVALPHIEGIINGATGRTADWADYDLDGDLDLLLTSEDSKAYVCQNHGGTFGVAATLAGPSNGTASWGDYDGDGDPDLLYGSSVWGGGGPARVYRNEGSSFVDTGAALPGGVTEWGDYDNDGDLDAFVNSRIYQNQGGSFVLDGSTGPFNDAYWPAWGDYDRDGDLDFLDASSNFGSGSQDTVLYTNHLDVPNLSPSVPIGLQTSRLGAAVTFTWDGATDDHTTSAGLTYNLRVGTTPGGSDVLNAPADLTDGRLRVARDGLASGNVWKLHLDEGAYYWSVQAVDSAYLGSGWAAERSFTMVGPTVSISDTSVVEGDGGQRNAVFTVTASWATPSGVSVQYATSDGLAVAGADYSTTAGTVIIPAGQTSATVSVPVLGDWADEDNENFLVTLSGPIGAQIGDDGLGEGTITDDDPVTINIDNGSILEQDGGQRDVVFVVTASRASDAPWAVDFATSDGTAVAGEDYTARSGTLNFSPGQLSATITIGVLGDWLDEGDETFVVTLGNSSGPVPGGTGAGQGVILDDDPLTVTIGDVSIAEGDSGQHMAVFTVSSSRVSDVDWSVGYATSDDTAVAGQDYTARAGTLTVPAGQLSGTITVPILGDGVIEDHEIFLIALTSSGVQIDGTGTARGTILDDDAPRLTLGDRIIVEGDAGQKIGVFTVRLSKPADIDIAVDYSTADGTAEAGSDYTATIGTLTIPAGRTSGTISVPVLGDTLVEEDETFSVSLDNPRGATISGAGVAQGMIFNNEGYSFTDLGTLGDWSASGLSIATSDDIDFYAFYAAGTGALRVDLHFTHALGDLDMVLVDYEKNFIAYSDGASDYEYIQPTIYGGEFYVLAVGGYAGATNTYTLDIDGPEAPTAQTFLSSDVVNEGEPVGAAVGTFQTDDPGEIGPFTYALVSGPGDSGNGSFQIVGNVLRAAAILDHEAQDTYTLRVRTTHGAGFFDQTLEVHVMDVNEAPVAFGSHMFATVDLASPGEWQAEDPEGDSLTFTVVDPPTHGTVTPAVDGFSYQPDEGYIGEDSFTFKANDGEFDSNTATMGITVDPANPPTAVGPVPLTVEEDESVAMVLSGSDLETPAGDLVYSLYDLPQHGTLQNIGPDGLIADPASLVYDADPRYEGTDSFSFRVRDRGGLFSEPATVQITVTDAYDLLITRPSTVDLTSLGVPARITLAGPGTVAVWLGHDGGIDRIFLDGTTLASTLTITPTLPSIDVEVTDITVAGSLNAIVGPRVDLLGSISVSGSINRIQLDDVADEHEITIGAPTVLNQRVTLTFDRVADLIVTSAMPISVLTATEWLDTDGAEDVIHAPAIGQLIITGSVPRGIPGDFQADLELTGTGTTANTLGSANIRGALTDSTWDIDGHAGTIVAGDAAAWELNIDGNLASLTLANASYVALSILGRVNSIRAAEWSGDITAASIGTLTVTGNTARELPGNFTGILSLTGTGTTAATLGSANFRGGLFADTWTIQGNVGSIIASGGGYLSLRATGYVTQVNGGSGLFSFTAQALYFGNIAAPGDLWADLTATGVNPQGISIGTIQARSANGYVRAPGRVSAIQAGTWASGSIHAASLGSLVVTGAGQLEYEPRLILDLTGTGTAVPTLGYARIAHTLGSEWAYEPDTWTIGGHVGTIILADINNWEFEIGGNIGLFQAGVVDRVELVADGRINALRATGWGRGSVEAVSLGSLVTTGNAALGFGYFGASLTLRGTGTAAPTFGSAAVAGQIGSYWDIDGHAGTIVSHGADSAVLNIHGNLGSFQPGAVNATHLTVGGRINSIQATQWDEGSITADSLGSLVTTGSTALSLPGNFSPRLTLSGVGIAPSGNTLGAANVRGAVAIPYVDWYFDGNRLWDIDGNAGSIRVGDAEHWTLDVEGNIGSLQLGHATNVELRAAGRVNSIRAAQWAEGEVRAASLGSLAVTGDTPRNLAGDFAARLILSDASLPQTLNSANIRGGMYSRDSSHIDGNVGSILATTVGNLGVTGNLGSLQLGDASYSEIWVDGRINSVRAFQWGGGAIHAASIGTLNITGNTALGLPGYFEAQLALTGTGTTAATLGSASIRGEIYGGTWDIDGHIGSITAYGGIAANWTLDAAGSVASINAVAAQLAGTISALYFGTINTTGPLNADITADGANASGLSINSLVGGLVVIITVDVPGRINAIRAAQWNAGEINAASLGTLTTTGNTLLALPGDFGAELTLTDGTPLRTLTSANIKGAIVGTTWDIDGHSGRITAGAIRNSTIDVLRDFAGVTIPLPLAAATAPTIVNSHIKAARILEASTLGWVQADNAGTKFGLTLNSPLTGGVYRPVSYKKSPTGATILWPSLLNPANPAPVLHEDTDLIFRLV